MLLKRHWIYYGGAIMIGGRGRAKNGFHTEAEEPLIKERAGSSRRKPMAVIFTFVILMTTWVVLSGRLDAFHLGLGLLSSLGVAWFSADLIFIKPPGGATLALWIRFIIYIPWLIWQILVANIHVLGLILSPRMKDLIDPHMVRFESELESDFALITFANSITLTPGTITVSVSEEGLFTIHALDKKSGDIGALKDMEAKVARTFGQRLSE